MPKIPFGRPYPNLDSVELSDARCESLIDGYIDEAESYVKRPGLTLFGTQGSAAWDGIYESIDAAIVIGVTNGSVYRINSGGTFTAFTGSSTLTAGVLATFAEDGDSIFVATGGDVAKLDPVGLTLTMMANNNWPTGVTHIVIQSGDLLTNGRNWTEIDILQEGDSVHALASSGTSYWAGVGSSVWISQDEGRTWRKQATLRTDGLRVKHLQALSATIVLALLDDIAQSPATGNPKIYRSTDGGETWSQVKDLTTFGLTSAAGGMGGFADFGSGTVVAIGAVASGNAQTMKSTDSGATWAAAVTVTTFGGFPPRICFMTGSTALAFLNDATNFVSMKTTDSGATWGSKVTILAGGGGPLGCVILSAATAVVIGSDAKSYKTIDTGATWGAGVTISSSAAEVFYSIISGGSGEVMAGGIRVGNINQGVGIIYKSADSAATWTKWADIGANTVTVIAKVSSTVYFAGVGTSDVQSTIPQPGAAFWRIGDAQSNNPGDVYFASIINDRGNGYQRADSWDWYNNEAKPDDCTALLAGWEEVHGIGQKSIEISVNSGAEGWARVPGGVLPFGIIAPYSVVLYEEQGFYLGLSIVGNDVQVIRVANRQATPLSTPYDDVIKGYTDHATARAWGPTIAGLPFYIITWPTTNFSLAYNIKRDEWYQWSFYNAGSLEAHLMNAYCFSRGQNKHFVGDRRANGRLYTLTGLTDNANQIVFELTSGWVSYGSDMRKITPRILYKAKRGQATDSSTPTFSVKFRNDGQPNFGNARTVSLGATNDTEFFGYLNRCGLWRQRQHRITHSDTKSDFILVHAEETVHVQQN